MGVISPTGGSIGTMSCKFTIWRLRSLLSLSNNCFKSSFPTRGLATGKAVTMKDLSEMPVGLLWPLYTMSIAFKVATAPPKL
ncbi:hypothetical protein COLO4_10244 [Corchorus olitorius]|uniref:Uncharacterized protein n=1 Tax=Corchorus olitorius TaxID=93759 RepID=A0A1R3K9F9_9ROSI|nr:hypothetical protein COLO4_10244 [Corchorus olitorius]